MTIHTSSRFTPSRPLWRFAVAGTLLFCLMYFLPVAATALLGQETLRAHARTVLTATLERPVSVEGDLRLTMQPWLGLHVGQVRVEDPGASGPDMLLSMEAVTLQLNLAALASRIIRVESLHVKRAGLRLTRDAHGRGNWMPMHRPEQEAPPESGGWRVEPFASGVRLDDAELHFSDAASGAEIWLNHIRLTTSAARPFQFSLSCRAKALPWEIDGELSAQGQGSYDAQRSFLLVHGASLAGWLARASVAGDPEKRVHATASMMFQGESGALELTDLAIEGLDARLTGRINAAALYEPQPYLHLDLSASAQRNGRWTALLETPPSGTAARPPETRDRLEARLVCSSTPGGWLASTISLADGAGRLEGKAGNALGQTSFDIRAAGLDLGIWLPRLAAVLPASQAASTSLDGRFTGADLAYGPVTLGAVELAAAGRDGTFRIYPFTARTSHAAFEADIRASASQPGFFGFSVQAGIHPLFAATEVQSPPGPLAHLAASGEAGPGGLSGKFSLHVAAPPKDWAPPWLSSPALHGWSALGETALSGLARIPAGKNTPWTFSSMNLQAASSRLSGQASLLAGKLSLDLQGERLDLDRLRPLAELFSDRTGHPAAVPPALLPPMDARIQMKHVQVWGTSLDGVGAEIHTQPGSVKVASFSGSALGGGFSGSLDFASAPGRRHLAGVLTANGLRGEQLSALVPNMPKLSGPLDCKIATESLAQGDAPLWQQAHGQADLVLGHGGITFSPESGASAPWPVGKAQTSFKYSLRPAQSPGSGREAALADLSGTLRVDSPGLIRSTQLDIKGQAGLDAQGNPLWFRQPKLDGAHTVVLPFGPPGTTVKAAWSARCDSDLEKGAFSLSGMDISLGGVAAKAHISGQPGPAGAVLSGALEVAEFSPRAALPKLGLPLPSLAAAEAWRKARCSMDIAGTLKEIRIQRIQGALEDSAISGQAQISGQGVKLDLSITTLDLDRLDPDPDLGNPGPSKRPEEPLPLSRLRELSLEARIRIGMFIKNKLTFENVLTELNVSSGRFHLRQSAPSFYGGSYGLDVRGDARGPEMTARLDLKITGFSAAALLKDMAGGTALAKGLTDFSLGVDTRGATSRALRRHASGQARFEVRDGRINLRSTPRKSPPRPSDAEAPAAQAPQPMHLSFSKMGAAFSIREGLGITRDFLLAGEGLTVKGDGWVHLDDERIDLNLKASVPDIGTFPVRVSGPLYNPHVDMDTAKLISDTIINAFKGILSIPGNMLERMRRIF